MATKRPNQTIRNMYSTTRIHYNSPTPNRIKNLTITSNRANYYDLKMSRDKKKKTARYLNTLKFILIII